MFACEQVFAMAIASDGDDVRMLAKKKDVGDREDFPRRDQPLLQGRRNLVWHEPEIHYPASFIRICHKPLKTRRRLPRADGALKRAAAKGNQMLPGPIKRDRPLQV
jgi:hypothetical protein